MTTIDKIRAEIERRFSEYNHDSNHHIQAAECASILSFLDTLEESVTECYDFDSLFDKFCDTHPDGNIKHINVGEK